MEINQSSVTSHQSPVVSRQKSKFRYEITGDDHIEVFLRVEKNQLERKLKTMFTVSDETASGFMSGIVTYFIQNRELVDALLQKLNEVGIKVDLSEFDLSKLKKPEVKTPETVEITVKEWLEGTLEALKANVNELEERLKTATPEELEEKMEIVKEWVNMPESVKEKMKEPEAED